MEKMYKLKHIHAGLGAFNGSLYFIIDKRLLRVSIGTPNYNDYNEWRLDEWVFAKEPYNPEDNKVELKPYPMEDMFLNSDDIKFLELSTRIITDDTLTDEERDNFFKKYPEVEFELAGTMYEGEKNLTFLREDKPNVKFDDWLTLKEINMTSSFENIFYPILNDIRNHYYKK